MGFTEILGECAFGDDVHVGWVLKGLLMREGRCQGRKNSTRFEDPVDLIHEFDKTEAALAVEVNQPRHVLNEVKGCDVVK